jgi:hypothetical protein
MTLMQHAPCLPAGAKRINMHTLLATFIKVRADSASAALLAGMSQHAQPATAPSQCAKQLHHIHLNMIA